MRHLILASVTVLVEVEAPDQGTADERVLDTLEKVNRKVAHRLGLPTHVGVDLIVARPTRQAA